MTDDTLKGFPKVECKVAVEEIQELLDRFLGEGYSKRNPDVVAAAIKLKEQKLEKE